MLCVLPYYWLCIAFVNQTGISKSGDVELIAVIHTHEVSLKLWIGMANLHFPCHRNILDWQKQYTSCRNVDVDF